MERLEFIGKITQDCHISLSALLTSLGTSKETGLSLTVVEEMLKEEALRAALKAGCCGGSAVATSNTVAPGNVIKVLRASEWTNVASPDLLVVGDIIKLDSGPVPPIDGIVIEASMYFMVDESFLTGEEPAGIKKELKPDGVPVAAPAKDDETRSAEDVPSAKVWFGVNTVIGKSNVISGTATIVVCAKGEDTVAAIAGL